MDLAESRQLAEAKREQFCHFPFEKALCNHLIFLKALTWGHCHHSAVALTQQYSGDTRLKMFCQFEESLFSSVINIPLSNISPSFQIPFHECSSSQNAILCVRCPPNQISHPRRTLEVIWTEPRVLGEQPWMRSE